MTEKRPQWAIIELFGHTQIAGIMSEASIGGCSFVRVDVPETKTCPGYTKLYGNGAIYAITLTDEETGKAAAEKIAPRPMEQFSARSMVKMLDQAKDEAADQFIDDYDDGESGV